MEPSSRLGTIVVHYGGGFTKNPLTYTGGALATMGEVKYHMYNCKSFYKYIVKITNSIPSVGLYYCIPGKDLSKGLAYIVCEADFKKFVKYANAHDGPIRVYVDVSKLDLSSFIEESDDEYEDEEVNEEPPQGKAKEIESDDDSQNSDYDVDMERESDSETESEIEIDNESDSESDCASLDHLSADEEEILECRKNKQNKKNEKFLDPKPNTKMSPTKERSPNKQPMPVLKTPTKEMNPNKQPMPHKETEKDEVIDTEHHSDADYNPNVEEGPEAEESKLLKSQMHDPTTHWRLMHPFKGERFESIDQFKDFIINYALANGYVLYYEESKKSHVLVRCGIRNAKAKKIVVENPCPFRLWASWITNEHTFQIKSLKSKHTCSRKHHLSEGRS